MFFLDEANVLLGTRQRALAIQGGCTNRNEGNEATALMDEALGGPPGQHCRGQVKVTTANPPRHVVALPGRRCELCRMRVHALD